MSSTGEAVENGDSPTPLVGVTVLERGTVYDVVNVPCTLSLKFYLQEYIAAGAKPRRCSKRHVCGCYGWSC